MKNELFLIELENDLKIFKDNIKNNINIKENNKNEKNSKLENINNLIKKLKSNEIEELVLKKLEITISNFNFINSKNEIDVILDNLNIYSQISENTTNKKNEILNQIDITKNELKNIKQDICFKKKILREKLRELNKNKDKIDYNISNLNENIKVYNDLIDNNTYNSKMNIYKIEIEDKRFKREKLKKEIRLIKEENEFKLNLKNNEYQEINNEFQEFMKKFN